LKDRLEELQRQRQRWNNEEIMKLAHDPVHIAGDRLLDFWEGKLTETERSDVERHVLSCKFCLDLLAAVGAQMPPEGIAPKVDS
jgi:hypothetical protein